MLAWGWDYTVAVLFFVACMTALWYAFESGRYPGGEE